MTDLFMAYVLPLIPGAVTLACVWALYRFTDYPHGGSHDRH